MTSGKKWTAEEVRQKFLSFFEKRGHVVIPSASLVPDEGSMTPLNKVLFNTAGMQPLVPYLMGEKHPRGRRIVNVQKCVRTTDIEDVGDNTHATFFEMLGNWSFGDYFKKEAIEWSYEFLTSEEEGLGLDPKRLYITVYAGDFDIPADSESANVWQSVGIPKNRIYPRGADNNWWPAVKGKDTWTGPTGPCSEMFYDITEAGLGDLSPEEFERADNEKKVVEIWNDVFMEYEKREGKILGKLEQKNVDTGAGLERLLMVLQEVSNIFETDVFSDFVTAAGKTATVPVAQRIIADHLRTAIFLLADGVTPSNTDRGYILRRLIRRAVYSTQDKRVSREQIREFVAIVSKVYGGVYTNILDRNEMIIAEISKEAELFEKTVKQGLKEFEKLSSGSISGSQAAVLSTTYGLPIDIIIEEAKKKNISVDLDEYNLEIEKHRNLSRASAEKKFKGGLSDTSETSTKYHTATHLLGASLRHVLGESVSQKGSNITPERLRFDFSFERKMTEEEKKNVENLVNQKIKEALPVSFEEMALEKARASGAQGVFGEKYGDTVKVYSVGKGNNLYSQEICGGPHVKNTNELGRFRIVKEEAVSAGVRRIKAVLE